MTLNGVIAPILHFSPISIALQADYVTVVEDRPIMSAKYSLPVPVFRFWPKLTHLQRGLSAIAELLVIILIFTPAFAVNSYTIETYKQARILQTRLQQELEKDDNAVCYSSPFFMYSRRQILCNIEAYNSALSTTNIPYLICYSVKV